MELVKNQEIYQLNTQLEGVNPNTLSELGQRDSDSLEILSNRIGGVLDGSSDDNWADNVKSGVTTAIGQIQEYINSGKAATNLIIGACGPVTNLQTICNLYVQRYDEYIETKNKEVEKYEKEGGEYKLNSSGNKIVSNDYVRWQQKIEAYEKTIPKIESDAIRIRDAVKKYFAAVDLTTNTINPEIYTEGSADLSIDYTEYFNGLMAITLDEWVGETTTEYTHDDEGHIIEKIEGDHTTQYEDGSHIDAHRTEERTYNDINEDGVVDETDELIYTKVHEEGTFTDADNNVYGYVGDREDDQIGLVHNEVTLTDQDSGDEVYHLEENREFVGEDPTTGFDTIEYSTEEREGGKTSQAWRSSSSIEGETIREEEYEFSFNSDGTGEYVASNGARTRYYRDSAGVLHQEFTGVDKHGNPKKPVDYVVNEDEYVVKTFRVIRNGEVIEEYPVRVGNTLDEARMRYDIECARADCDVSGGTINSLDEVNRLTDPSREGPMSGSIAVVNGNGDEGYVWELVDSE